MLISKLKTVLKKTFLIFGFQLQRVPKDKYLDFFSIYLGIRSTTDKPTLTIQIGANDGKTNDPIYSSSKVFSDKIILVEPQFELHDKLRLNYGDYEGELEILDCLIAEAKHEQVLYRLKESYHSVYNKRSNSNPTGISSISKLHLQKMLTKHGFKEKEQEMMIEHLSIRCKNLFDLLKNYMLSHCIVLQVDCEGADWLVIKTLGDVRPNIINFEQKHLSSEDSRQIQQWLGSQGYLTHSHGGDCLAYRELN